MRLFGRFFKIGIDRFFGGGDFCFCHTKPSEGDRRAVELTDIFNNSTVAVRFDVGQNTGGDFVRAFLDRRAEQEIFNFYRAPFSAVFQNGCVGLFHGNSRLFPTIGNGPRITHAV